MAKRTKQESANYPTIRLTSRKNDIGHLREAAEVVSSMLRVASLRVIEPGLEIETAGDIMASCAGMLEEELGRWEREKIGDHPLYERDVKGAEADFVVVPLSALAEAA